MKYPAEQLLPMLRKAAALRDEMLVAGFTDNGGAIHSASRIVDILGMRLRYPGLTHLRMIRHFSGSEFSEAAWEVHQAGGDVYVEHVAPLRELTRQAISMIADGCSDEVLVDFIKTNYRLVLLTAEETTALNRVNRSRLDPRRVDHIKIRLR